MKSIFLKLSSLILSIAILSGCGGGAVETSKEADVSTSSPSSEVSEEVSSTQELEKILVGASPAPHTAILQAAAPELEALGYALEIVPFTDYILPNQALESGEITANFFQHKPYLDKFNAERGTNLVSVASIHFEPLGIYAGKTESIQALPDGAEIAVPNDTSNEARALELLAKQGLIELAPNSDLTSTVKDITSNPKNLKILELEAAQLPRSLQDLDLAVINGNYAIDAKITDKVLEAEDNDSAGAQTFANILAVRAGEEKSAPVQALVKAMQSETVRKHIEETYNGLVIPVF